MSSFEFGMTAPADKPIDWEQLFTDPQPPADEPDQEQACAAECCTPQPEGGGLP